jgi:hypothetical protein
MVDFGLHFLQSTMEETRHKTLMKSISVPEVAYFFSNVWWIWLSMHSNNKNATSFLLHIPILAETVWKVLDSVYKLLF